MSPRMHVQRWIPFLMALLLLLAGAVSCKRAYATTQIEPPEVVVARYLNALQRNDYSTANACLTDGERNVFAISQPSGTEMDALYAQLMQKFVYTLETPATTTGGGTSTPVDKTAAHTDAGLHKQITVNISTLNVPELFDHTIEELSAQYAASLVNAAPIPEDKLEESLYLKLACALDSPDSPRLAGRVQIPVVLREGEWKIEADSELYNAVTGNFFEIVARLPALKSEG